MLALLKNQFMTTSDDGKPAIWKTAIFAFLILPGIAAGLTLLDHERTARSIDAVAQGCYVALPLVAGVLTALLPMVHAIAVTNFNRAMQSNGQADMADIYPTSLVKSIKRSFSNSTFGSISALSAIVAVVAVDAMVDASNSSAAILAPAAYVSIASATSIFLLTMTVISLGFSVLHAHRMLIAEADYLVDKLSRKGS